MRVEDKWQRVLWEYTQNALHIQEIIRGISILKEQDGARPVVEIIELPKMQVMSIRRDMELHGTMVFADRFIELNDLCERKRLHYDMGAYAINHCSYLSQFNGNRIDLETMIPLKQPVAIFEGIREFGGFKGVSTIHVGPYELMLPAYQSCIRWAADNNIGIMEQSVEEYILASDSVMNPSQYITRLILPLAGSIM